MISRRRKNENVSFKCQKMKYARAKRAKILFSIVKYANLWGFCCRRRRGCLSSLKIDCRNAKLHFQMTFSLPSPSCLLKLYYIDNRSSVTANKAINRREIRAVLSNCTDHHHWNQLRSKVALLAPQKVKKERK